MTAASATVQSAPATTGGSANLLAGIFGFFERIAAAHRFANAVDMRRRPAQKDIETLGLEMFDFRTLPH
jgi:hypothetical protein